MSDPEENSIPLKVVQTNWEEFYHRFFVNQLPEDFEIVDHENSNPLNNNREEEENEKARKKFEEPYKELLHHDNETVAALKNGSRKDDINTNQNRTPILERSQKDPISKYIAATAPNGRDNKPLNDNDKTPSYTQGQYDGRTIIHCFFVKYAQQFKNDFDENFSELSDPKQHPFVFFQSTASHSIHFIYLDDKQVPCGFSIFAYEHEGKIYSCMIHLRNPHLSYDKREITFISNIDPITQKAAENRTSVHEAITACTSEALDVQRFINTFYDQNGEFDFEHFKNLRDYIKKQSFQNNVVPINTLLNYNPEQQPENSNGSDLEQDSTDSGHPDSDDDEARKKGDSSNDLTDSSTESSKDKQDHHHNHDTDKKDTQEQNAANAKEKATLHSSQPALASNKNQTSSPQKLTTKKKIIIALAVVLLGLTVAGLLTGTLPMMVAAMAALAHLTLSNTTALLIAGALATTLSFGFTWLAHKMIHKTDNCFGHSEKLGEKDSGKIKVVTKSVVASDSKEQQAQSSNTPSITPST